MWFAPSSPTANPFPPLTYRRAAVPGPLFLTLGLREPRGSVRFGLGGRLLRAARFSFFRSALSLMFLVFINTLIAPCNEP